ncbi:hypothetical protein CLV93_11445 [Prolixibacter denitrificans]|uniref:Uncharacterized protein n=1 Tax=Prolixibacter denitrificans TaxID=1541063 RepID=A0A2P8C6K4_9BACT|nr:hypothetical protein CLV93_11445 [Prolixibacter denitrificans]
MLRYGYSNLLMLSLGLSPSLKERMSNVRYDRPSELKDLKLFSFISPFSVSNVINFFRNLILGCSKKAGDEVLQFPFAYQIGTFTYQIRTFIKKFSTFIKKIGIG